ncbi:NADP-binding protein [Dacryopinax primogenitus]|uniref:NADP-binding protein n=1 Tax=Dacryopinax primogenitus (strain DJM 731) TaxID=1858805 RepID=M5G382_DACPD|nr:NADP-binding protein [Dacryopinax primogenitus]EJT98197.1 NADP-binding protein [Dacryopinax primogenitus]
MYQAFTEMCPPAPKWTVGDMPDLAGKVIIVTGGNTGIGFITCKYLLLHNATVYMLCRSPNKAQDAIHQLQDVTGGKEAKFIQCDLADLPSVKRCVQEFTSKEQRLDVLFNSAGVMFPPIEQVTKQNFDLQFGTNVIGHCYLTVLLLPILLSTAQESGNKVRVINTSSDGHILFSPKEGINYDVLSDSPERRKMATTAMYGMSKWGNVVFSKELARRYGSQGVISHALNPGHLRTELQRHGSGLSKRIADMLLFELDPLGALTQLYAGTAAEAGEVNGQYYIPWARHGQANDPEAGKQLWAWLEKELKKYWL